MAGSRQRRALVAGNNTAILFEALFNNAQHSVATSRQNVNHSIVLGYAGNIYTCNQNTEQARSVHTIHTEDEDDEDVKDDESNVRSKSKPSCQSKSQRQSRLNAPPSSLACLKRSPTRQSTTQKTTLQPPSPRKLKRSRTLSPSHPPKTNAILAQFASISRKLSRRRDSYDSNAKTQSEQKLRARPKVTLTRLRRATSFRIQQPPSRNTCVQPQIPIHVPYQTQFPTLQYIPVNQTQHVISTAPPTTPAAYQHLPQSAPTLVSGFPPGLQSLQNEINRVTSSLSANPMNSQLGHELSRLVTERNSLLDSATKQTRCVTPNFESNKSSPKAESRKGDPETEKKVVDQHETGVSVQNRVTDDYATRLQVESPSQLHFCTGCGQARSTSFHRKHRYTKSVHNVCKKCREGKRAIAVLDRYRFCNSCGIVRSKEFHRRHVIFANIPVRSKTCRRCYMNSKSIRTAEEKSKLFKTAEPASSQRRQSSPEPVMHVSGNKSRNSVRSETPCSETVEPRRRSNSSQHRTQGLLSNYDGIADSGRARGIEAEAEPVPSSEFSANRRGLNAYVSPDHCDDHASSHDPASLERSPRLPTSASPVPNIQSSSDQKPSVLTSHPPNPDSASSHTPHLSRDDLQHDPYYPRLRATETNTPYPNSPLSPRPNSSQNTQHDAAPDSPVLEEGKSSFVDSNKSRPGNLHVPLPSAFAGFNGIGRKGSLSDGSKTPANGITMPLETPYETNFEDKQRYTKGAFCKLSSSFKPSAPRSPWESFSGPICNPSSDRGSRGAFFEARAAGSCGGSHDGSNFEPLEAKESIFGSYNASEQSESPTEPAGFSFRFGQPKSYSRRHARPGSYTDQGSMRGGSTRGAWNINTSFCGANSRSTASTFARSTHDHVPEPIIEEPSSPISKSPTATPLLLEFSRVDNLSDSGVEFLTDSSSSHSSSPRSDGSLDSNMDALTLSHIQQRKL